MADALIVITLLLTGFAATTAALTRDLMRQAAVLALLGLCLAALLTVLRAPGVELSRLAIGGAITTLLLLLAVRRGRRDERSDDRPE
ncbi:hydrogenase subunit MbhD domain-containing protein [Kitasatospora sp. NPDC059599]|uniref:hydrogenase subunit MbhD domain-containing protein n=1 Tax=Kitasatospora sp. NPDC059599 TaxID=3346880 RepID=UPI0036965F37